MRCIPPRMGQRPTSGSSRGQWKRGGSHGRDEQPLVLVVLDALDHGLLDPE
jgi:hypothetical protein